MTTLEDEALLYAGINPDELIDLGNDGVKVAGHFIAGANSKWVQAEKIKAQIEVLNDVRGEFNSDNRFYIDDKLEQLEQQLKELEDEKYT